MNFAPFLDRRAKVRLTGAVYTPSDVAAALIDFAMRDLPDRPIRILEPSAGDGAFLGQLARMLPGDEHVAVDIDAATVTDLRTNAAAWPAATELHERDFIDFACDAIEETAPSYDLVIGNPPFVRKHNFSDAFKVALTRLSALIDYPLVDLKNSWAAFLAAASRLVSNDGTVAFVLPYELMTVAYGHAALRAMLAIFPRIDLFVSEEKAFPEIEQDAVLFIGRRQPRSPRGLFIQRVRHMSDLSAAIEHHVSLDNEASLALDLNAFLIGSALVPTLRRLKSTLQSFSDLATSAPGVVTAANDFFILKDSEVDRLNLRRHVVPILKKQNPVDRSPVFAKHDFDALAKREPCQLLIVHGEVADLDADLQSYIAKGVEAGLPKRYKMLGRKNWYEVRLVPAAPGFFFKRSHGYPRLCLNEAGVHTTDTAYGIRPRGGITMRGICFSFYNSLTMLFAETDGRFYGGGVLELSPNELKNLPIVYREPSDQEFAAFLTVHEAAGNDPTAILDFGDAWLKNHPAVRNLDLAAVRRAWAALRAHRLRHSSRTKAKS